jgi:hypothetical protein
METIKVSNIDVFVKESVTKGVNSVKLINIEIKISCNCYKSFKNTCSERSGIRVLGSRLLKISTNYKPSFTSSKVSIFVCLVSKNPYH